MYYFLEFGLQTGLRYFHLKKAGHIFFLFEPSKETPTDASHQRKPAFSSKVTRFSHSLWQSTKNEALIFQILRCSFNIIAVHSIEVSNTMKNIYIHRNLQETPIYRNVA